MANIVLGITGGIAAYKAAELTSSLVKEGHNIDVIMTKSATKFITPLTFSSLTNNNVVVDMFDTVNMDTEHISLAKKADLMVIAPASANTIAKMAHGFADNMLTTTALATTAPIIVAPAMNTNMYENPVTLENIEKLKKRDIKFIDPEVGYLACGDIGRGKLAKVEDIKWAIDVALNKDKSYIGKRVLISAGPTIAKIDPVRYVSNYSSGKMGFALAREALLMGAEEVTIVCGKTSITPPLGCKIIHVDTTQSMQYAIASEVDNHDVLIMAAAPADFKSEYAEQKIKKQTSFHLNMEKDIDILQSIAENKKIIHVGFAAESENLILNATEKLNRKKLDLIVANDISNDTIGFNSDENEVYLITKNKQIKLSQDKKTTIASEILKFISNELF